MRTSPSREPFCEPGMTRVREGKEGFGASLDTSVPRELEPCHVCHAVQERFSHAFEEHVHTLVALLPKVDIQDAGQLDRLSVPSKLDRCTWVDPRGIPEPSRLENHTVVSIRWLTEDAPQRLHPLGEHTAVRLQALGHSLKIDIARNGIRRESLQALIERRFADEEAGLPHFRGLLAPKEKVDAALAQHNLLDLDGGFPEEVRRPAD